MARIAFLNSFNNQTMANVQANIKEVTVVKPMDNSAASTFYNASGSSYVSTKGQLIGILPNKTTFAADSSYIQSMLPNPLTVSNLTVTGNTILGDSSTDTITLNGKVIGLNAPETDAIFDTVTANDFIGGNFSGTTVHATTGEFDNLKVGGQPYRPFIIQGNAPTGSGKGNYLWINTSHSVVPIVMYTTATDPVSSADWHPLGAVFG